MPVQDPQEDPNARIPPECPHTMFAVPSGAFSTTPGGVPTIEPVSGASPTPSEPHITRHAVDAHATGVRRWTRVTLHGVSSRFTPRTWAAISLAAALVAVVALLLLVRHDPRHASDGGAVFPTALMGTTLPVRELARFDPDVPGSLAYVPGGMARMTVSDVAGTAGVLLVRVRVEATGVAPVAVSPRDYTMLTMEGDGYEPTSGNGTSRGTLPIMVLTAAGSSAEGLVAFQVPPGHTPRAVVFIQRDTLSTAQPQGVWSITGR
jgi:hypothetical protein